jgi:hypothetical protein
MAVISVDTPCPGCGYNRRGLKNKQRCPECGLVFDHEREKPIFSRLPRLTAFDQVCVFFSIVAGGILLIAGPIGILVAIGERVGDFVTPVLASLTGWGILRCVHIGLRADRRSKTNANDATCSSPASTAIQFRKARSPCSIARSTNSSSSSIRPLSWSRMTNLRSNVPVMCRRMPPCVTPASKSLPMCSSITAPL